MAALYLLLLVGLAAIPLGLGGNFIILVAALALALATKFQVVSVAALLVMAGMVVAGEILEAILGSLLARRYGASRWGMAGAFVGGIVGAIPGTAVMPVLGSLVGSFLGRGPRRGPLEWWHRRRLDPVIARRLGRHPRAPCVHPHQDGDRTGHGGLSGCQTAKSLRVGGRGLGHARFARDRSLASDAPPAAGMD